MSISEANQLSGSSLTVVVMDIIREQHREGRIVTNYTVRDAIVQRFQLSGELRSSIYHKVRLRVNELAASGMIRKEEKRNASKQFTYHLFPC